MRFVILKTTVGSREDYQSNLEQYSNYLKSLYQKESLISAGTFDDRSGGMLIVDAEGLEQAIAIARKDPMVMAGVDRYLVRGWSPSLENEEKLAGGDLSPKVDPSSSGPIKVMPSEENFSVIDATEHPQYDELMTQCFAANQIGLNEPNRKEFLRKATPRGLQKLLLMFDDQIAGQIEFATPAASGLPLSGEDLTIIHCIWVKDEYTGLEGGRRLLAACAEKAGTGSLATIGYNATIPWMPHSFFTRQGFVVVDQVETNRFFGDTPIVAYLLWRPLHDNLSAPTWRRKELLEGVKFCPAYPWLNGKRIYWGQDYAYHGIVLKEGLRRPEVVNQFPQLGTRRSTRWTFYKIGIPKADLNRAVELIQNSLVNEPTYFAHVYGEDDVVIIFPDRVFHAGVNAASWKDAIRYGVDRGIPEGELNFHPCTVEEETF